MNKKLTVEEFVMLTLEKHTTPDRKTVHTVYSGFNNGFRKYFPGEDPIKAVDKLFKDGKISFRLCRGGALIALPGEIKPNLSDPNNFLNSIGIASESGNSTTQK